MIFTVKYIHIEQQNTPCNKIKRGKLSIAVRFYTQIKAKESKIFFETYSI
jgi:hypothetical protein